MPLKIFRSAAAENLVKNGSPPVRIILDELFRSQRLNDADAKRRIAQKLLFRREKLAAFAPGRGVAMVPDLPVFGV